MKAAVIGLGVGLDHVRAYAEAGCEIVCVIDWDKELREEVAAEYGARSASQLTPVPQEKEHLADADVVSVCSWDQYHFEHIRILWEQGKHIVCEKPPVLRRDHFHALQQMVESRPQQKFMCNLPLTRHPQFAELADVDFGDIYLMEATYDWGRHEKLLGWRSETPGYSVTLGAGLHMVDLMLWLKEWQIVDGGGLGVNANTPEFPNNDTVVGMWKFADRSLGVLKVLCATEGMHAHELRVWGTKTSRNIVNTGRVDKTPLIREFLEAETWDNTRLWHAMDVCLNIEASVHG